MTLFDDLFGWMRWYRRMRGGQWYYASCPDGGWMRKAAPMADFARDEDWRSPHGR